MSFTGGLLQAVLPVKREATSNVLVGD